MKTSPENFAKIAANASAMGAETRAGRLLRSAKLAPGEQALSVKDPDSHWFEIISEAA